MKSVIMRCRPVQDAFPDSGLCPHSPVHVLRLSFFWDAQICRQWHHLHLPLTTLLCPHRFPKKKERNEKKTTLRERKLKTKVCDDTVRHSCSLHTKHAVPHNMSQHAKRCKLEHPRFPETEQRNKAYRGRKKKKKKSFSSPTRAKLWQSPFAPHAQLVAIRVLHACSVHS